MQDNAPEISNHDDVAGKTRIVGYYLLFVAGIVLLIACVIGLFVLVAYAVAGTPNDPASKIALDNFLVWSISAFLLLFTTGAVLAYFGLKQVLNPVNIRHVNR